MKLPTDWSLDQSHKESKKLNELVNSYAKKLIQNISSAPNDATKYQAVHAFYRKYYGLTLVKNLVDAGINRSPTRDIILDFPWKDLNLNRILCLKIWEKINH